MKSLSKHVVSVAFVASTLATGCTAQVAGDGDSSQNGGNAGQGNGGEGNNDSSGSNGGTTSGKTGPGVAETPLRRLSRPEYAGTIAAAFADLGVNADATLLPQDELVAGFSTQTFDTFTDASLRKYVEMADGLGQAVGKQSVKFLGSCDRTKRGDADCLAAALAPRLVSLFRKAVPATEASNMVKAVMAAAPGAPIETLVAGVVARALLAPEFLFKLEKGKAEPTHDGVFALSSGELAVRLSYFLWRQPPDAALKKLGDDGSLSDPKTLAAQVDRLIEDPRAAPAIKAFHVEWLKLNKLEDRSKSTQIYPTFNEDLRRAMLQESELFFDGIGRSVDGTWQDVLTSKQTFVNKSLGSLYGITAGATDFSKVTLGDDSKRIGVLTQASFLTAHSHAENTQMIHRGLIVREQILCQTIPPPEDVDITKQVDRLVTQPCASCHAPMEAIGTGFEAFDGIGKLKAAASPQGKIVNLESGDKEFKSVAELASILVAQPETSECVARQWFRFALGRSELVDGQESADERSVQAVATAIKNDGRIRTLIKAIVKSDAFAKRRQAPAACN